MNYKPDESTLISYLYKELANEQNEKVEEYFRQNPEERKKVQQLGTVLGILSQIDDKEVIAPPVFMEQGKSIRPLWSSTVVRTLIGIAASFILILVAARMLQTEVNYTQGELRITFGKVKPVGRVDPSANQAGLTSEEVQQMISRAVAENNQLTEARLSENEKKQDQQIRKSLAANSDRIDQLLNEASLASREQLRGFVANLQDSNMELMKDYLQLSASDQQKYVENLLVDFSKYLQEQRNQDLEMFQTRFTSVEQNTNVLKQETEQLLASLISSNGKKQNNY